MQNEAIAADSGLAMLHGLTIAVRAAVRRVLPETPDPTETIGFGIAAMCELLLFAPEYAVVVARAHQRVLRRRSRFWGEPSDFCEEQARAWVDRLITTYPAQQIE